MASDPGNPSSEKSIIRITYLLSTLDISCLFMQVAVTPYLARDLGLDSVGFGYLQTFFGILQLLGGPVFGRFSDQYGARAALTLSFLSGSLYYLIIAFSTSIPVLFLSRLPSVFMHGLPGAQMIVTDLTNDNERAHALGKLGLCFGIGIIVGSSLGGFLATRFGHFKGGCMEDAIVTGSNNIFSTQTCLVQILLSATAVYFGSQSNIYISTDHKIIYTPTCVALLTSIICSVIVMLYIPAQTKRKDGATPEKNTKKNSSVFNFGELTRLLEFPGVIAIFIIKVVSGFPIGIFMIMFSVISANFFGLDAATAGYLMSYFGILQLVVQGVFVGMLTSRFSDNTLLLLSMAVSILVGFGMIIMTNVLHFCIIAFFMVFALCFVGVITDSILTKAVPPSDTGAMLGLCASIQPFTRTIGPTIGGYLYKHHGVPSFGYLNIIVNLSLIVYFLKVKTNPKKEKTK